MRLAVVFRRWLDIIIYALLAAELWIFFINNYFIIIRNIYSVWYTTTLIIIAAFIALRWIAKKRTKFTGLFGYRHIHTYPPLWLAVILGGSWLLIRGMASTHYSSLTLSVDSLQVYQAHIPLEVIISIIAIITMAIVIYFLHKGGQKESTSKEEVQSLEPVAESYIAQLQEPSKQEFRSLLIWLKTDTPVQRTSSDRFEHTSIAGRIARRLRGDSEQRPTIGVVGPYGSGKTSIANIVNEELEGENRICLVQISAWPYENVEALIRGITHELVRELSIHVNTLAVTGLSERYLASIAEAGGVWASLARLLRIDESPRAILQRFADILTATNLYFVLWLDDLSRFGEGKSHQTEQIAPHGRSELEPVRSLLHLLDQCPNLSVIVADSTLGTRTDLGKIARFVEYIPKLTPSDVWPIIRMLRDACLNGYPKQIQDPTSLGERDKISQAYIRSFDYLLAGPPIDFMTIAVGIPILLDTPRKLKSALRLTLDIWEQLAGEIDFDDVLIASILRTIHADIFALISDNRDQFITGFRERSQLLDNDQQEYPVLSRLDKYLTEVKEEYGSEYAKAIELLISHLLPNFRDQTEAVSGRHILTPQKLNVRIHTDNWDNYLAVPNIKEEQSDQKAIQSIQSWQNGEESDLIVRLRDRSHSPQITTFVGLFKKSELCRLLREVVQSYLHESAAEWEDHSRATAVTYLFYMMEAWTPEKSLILNTLFDLFEITVPSNLPLTQHVFQYFGEPTRDSYRFFHDEEEFQTIRARLDALLAETFQPGEEQIFIDALKDTAPYNFAWLILGHDRQRRGEVPFDGWTGLAALLLNVAESEPEIGWPILLPFITQSDTGLDRQNQDDRDEPRHLRTIQVEFLADEAQRLFDYPRLPQLLAEAPEIDNLNEDLRLALDVARQAALIILEEMNQEEEAIEEGDGQGLETTDTIDGDDG